LLPFDCYFLAAICAVSTDQAMCLKAACGTLATAGRREWTRGQTAPGLIHLQILDDKCVPSQVRWFCSLRLRRMQGLTKLDAV